MSHSADFDEDASKRTFTAPYSSHHPVPTIQGYEEIKEEREEEAAPVDANHQSSPKSSESKKRSLLSSAKGLLKRDSTKPDSRGSSGNEVEPYKHENRNRVPHVQGYETVQNGHKREDEREAEPEQRQDVKQFQEANHPFQNESPPTDKRNQAGHSLQQQTSQQKDGHGNLQAESDTTRDDASGQHENAAPMQDTSEATDNTNDPRQKRKNMKHMKRDKTEREVTDPITHLPVVIHDFTSEELGAVPENGLPPSGNLPSATGASGKTKSSSQIEKETDKQQSEHEGMKRLFPPPNFDNASREIADIYTVALSVGLALTLLVSSILLVCVQLISPSQENHTSWRWMFSLTALILGASFLSGAGIIFALRHWLRSRIYSVWDDHLWDAARNQEIETSTSPIPESVEWLNSLLASVWGLINPDLFTSLVDTLEDVMQASLPKFVRMISVEDLGQGSEAIRILGIRWLPTGAASKSVTQNGAFQGGNSQGRDRRLSGDGQVSNGSNGASTNGKQQEGDNFQNDVDDQDVAEGMEAEEGDFVNVEVAFSYRASTTSKSLQNKSKNAHLFLGFYLPGGFKFPVWVEMRGMVGTMRMRLQLCPDPPFFALCTLTLLGQPKAEMSCIPLTKKGLNIMDLPLISSFVQSSIDAALAEYVAPKSLTINLKDMLVGDDCKKDTTTTGVIVVRIKRGRDFKFGDPGMLGLTEGSSDAYVAVGWAKFGKPVWSTRVILDDMQPVWDETAYILVGPEELNAEERLRVQLWDSDRLSADDDLGRVEVNLKELMTSGDSHCKMHDRTDGFQSLKESETMPGALDWSVGYFPKTRVQQEQLDKQNIEPDVHNISDLKEKVSRDADHKLREAHRELSDEIEYVSSTTSPNSTLQVLHTSHPSTLLVTQRGLKCSSPLNRIRCRGCDRDGSSFRAQLANHNCI